MKQNNRKMNISFTLIFLAFGSCFHAAEGKQIRPEIEKDIGHIRIRLPGGNGRLRGRNLGQDKKQDGRDSSSSSDGCHSVYLEWWDVKIEEMGRNNFHFLMDEYIDLLAFEYKRAIDGNVADEYFGLRGEQTSDMLKIHKLAKKFFDRADPCDEVDLQNVKLLGAHGIDLRVRKQLKGALTGIWVFDDDNELEEYTDNITSFIEKLPRSYDNPLLTFGAISFPPFSDENTGMTYEGSVVMGDGMFQFLEEIDLIKYGAETIYAHEFAHQVQYAIGPTESLLHTELMADSIGSYFLGHKKGANMKGRQLHQVHETLFSWGDCSPDNPEHHGLPAQRDCAAVWGTNQAKQDSCFEGETHSHKKIMHPIIYLDKFDKVFEDILSLDRKVCQYRNKKKSVNEQIKEKQGLQCKKNRSKESGNKSKTSRKKRSDCKRRSKTRQSHIYVRP